MKRLSSKTEVETLSTTEALRCLAKGPDDRAWTTVLDRHGAEIFRATQRILGDPMSAEDACQETLLQIRDRAGQFRGRPGAPDTMARNWIMRIACNTALHMLRQRRRSKLREQNVAREANQLEEASDFNPHPNEELSQRVRAELAELPEKQRLPLVLHFFAGLNYEQISLELRCGVGAARARVHRALEKLRERMALVGIVVTTAALYAALSTTTAHAAEVVLNPERYARWHGLLMSSQQAAINVVTDPGFTAMSKIGFAAAASAVCGAVALTCGPKTADRPAVPATPVPVSTQAQPAPLPQRDAVENTPPASRSNDVAPAPPAASVANTQPKIAKEVKPAAIVESETPSVRPAPRRTASAEKAERATARSASTNAHSEGSAYNPSETGDHELFSPLAQLEMVKMMQHELNIRVARIHDTINAHGMITPEDQVHLQRAADDQSELSNLVRRLSDEIRYSEPEESRHAGLGK